MIIETVNHSAKIQLVNRDWEILDFINQQGYATFDQIKKRFFNTQSFQKTICWRRLDKLIDAGLLSKTKISHLFSETIKKNRKLPYTKGVAFKPNTTVYFLSKPFSSKHSFSDNLLKIEMLYHQLLLSELRLYLDTVISADYILNDPHIKVISKHELGRHEQIRPDLSYETNSFRVAVELERSQKAKSRYYERFIYYENSIYNKVIYYCTDRKSVDYLLNQSRSFERIAIGYFQNPEVVIHNVFGQIDLKTFINKP